MKWLGASRDGKVAYLSHQQGGASCRGRRVQAAGERAGRVCERSRADGIHRAQRDGHARPGARHLVCGRPAGTDISDAAHPFQLAELRPEPLAHVDVEDPGLGGNPIEMWSYPVVDHGLIYVVDVRNGLYVLRYHGRWGEQLATLGFREGNSNNTLE